MKEKTVQEFADELGVTKQAIHYRFKDLPSNKRVKNSQNIIVLTSEEQSILKGLFKGNSQNKQSSKGGEKVKKESFDRTQKEFDLIIESKNEQIIFLQNILKNKDKRIDNLLKKIDDLTQLLNQQQHLQLQLQKKQEEAERMIGKESKNEEKSFWNFLFKRYDERKKNEKNK